jgi:DNA (cytosine-5)-methyltransferase 1
MGYARAGFDVTGVDIKSQPHYPFRFVQGDALEYLEKWGGELSIEFDAVHASPPCQAHSDLRSLWQDRPYKDLIAPTRALLERLANDHGILTDMPWVIENVEGAPLRPDLVLCGSMFDLGANGRQLRRHRWFESNVLLMSPGLCGHQGQPVGVYGHGGGGKMTRGYRGTAAEYREAMGIAWATKAEIAQAIPPAYTEWIGRQLLRALEVAA